MRRAPAREYQIVIPSYQRAEGLQQKTLAWLGAAGVDPTRITVFLHDNDPQLEAYQALAGRTGIRLNATPMRGITAQRTYIPTQFAPGTPIVCLDDDVTGLVEAVDSKTLRPVADVDALFRRMFTETAGRDLYVWGLSPVVNAFYMSPGRISEGLRFLIFTVIGFFNRPGHPVHEFTVPYKDEHETSLRAWWYDGGTVRHDGIAAQANYYTDPGGCQAPGEFQRTPAKVAFSVEELEKQWPGLVRRNTRKKDTGYIEITLAPKKRHAGHPSTTPPPGARAAKAGSP